MRWRLFAAGLRCGVKPLKRGEDSTEKTGAREICPEEGRTRGKRTGQSAAA